MTKKQIIDVLHSKEFSINPNFYFNCYSILCRNCKYNSKENLCEITDSPNGSRLTKKQEKWVLKDYPEYFI